MRIINSYQEFNELRKDALIARGLTNTNFLLTTEELKSEILYGNISFINIPDCFLIILKRFGVQYLYIWLNEPRDAKEIKNTINLNITTSLNYFAKEGSFSIWDEVAELIGLTYRTKVLKHSGKVDAGLRIKVPDGFTIVLHENTDYKYLMGLLEPYFDPVIGALPSESNWEKYKINHKLFEVYSIDGELAAFFSGVYKNNRCVCEGMVTVPKFRNKGIMGSLFISACRGQRFFSDWIFEWNKPSISFHNKMGIMYDNNYRVFYDNISENKRCLDLQTMIK